MDHFILGSMFFGKDLENQRVVILNKKKRIKGLILNKICSYHITVIVGCKLLKTFLYTKNLLVVFET